MTPGDSSKIFMPNACSTNNYSKKGILIFFRKFILSKPQHHEISQFQPRIFIDSTTLPSLSYKMIDRICCYCLKLQHNYYFMQLY